MKDKEEKFAFERFQRFFYPVLDLDEGKPNDPKERARLCWEHFVKPWALEMVGEDECWKNNDGTHYWQDDEQQAGNIRAEKIRKRIEDSIK